MQWLKGKLRRWLFPEYARVCSFMAEMEEARRKVIEDSKDISIQGPVVIVGSLNNCRVDVNPTIKPRIVLSEVLLKSLLSIDGSHHSVLNSYFTGKEATAVEMEKCSEGEH